MCLRYVETSSRNTGSSSITQIRSISIPTFQVWSSSRGKLLLPGARRKVVKHLADALVELFNVFVGVVRECIARRSAPNQLLVIRVEDVDEDGSDLVRFHCRGRVFKSSP